MQDYDESFFIAKANKRASITWFVLLLIASVFYGIKVGRGQLKEAYFAGFFVAGWLSYLGGRILLRFKHADSLRYKWVVGLGYLIFYAVIAWTSLDEVSYVFILPLVCIPFARPLYRLLEISTNNVIPIIVRINFGSL